MSTVIAATMEEFPECLGYGFSAQPQYLVNINMRQGGFEDLNQRWARPLLTFVTTPTGDRDEEVIQSILNFWHAMGGRATVFRFKDWSDFKSCNVSSIPTPFDQPLAFVDGVTVPEGGLPYQMSKLYQVGSLSQNRKITQPFGSTIRVANGAGVEQSDFIVDESSGMIVPGGSFDGVPLTWGGEFFVPSRFDSEMSVSVVDKLIQSADFTVREVGFKSPTLFPDLP